MWLGPGSSPATARWRNTPGTSGTSKASERMVAGRIQGRWFRPGTDRARAASLSSRFRVQPALYPVEESVKARLNNLRRGMDVAERKVRTVVLYGKGTGMELAGAGQRGVAPVPQVGLPWRLGSLALPADRHHKGMGEKEATGMGRVVGAEIG